jgi:hypothetical protein
LNHGAINSFRGGDSAWHTTQKHEPFGMIKQAATNREDNPSASADFSDRAVKLCNSEQIAHVACERATEDPLLADLFLGGILKDVGNVTLQIRVRVPAERRRNTPAALIHMMPQ